MGVKGDKDEVGREEKIQPTNFGISFSRGLKKMFFTIIPFTYCKVRMIYEKVIMNKDLAFSLLVHILLLCHLRIWGYSLL
jgi:hypothetical protein